MRRLNFIVVFHCVFYVTVLLNSSVFSLENKSLSQSVLNGSLADSSHEEIHSKGSNTLLPVKHDIITASLEKSGSSAVHESVKKIQINTNKTHHVNITAANITHENTTNQGKQLIIATEGGNITAETPMKKDHRVPEHSTTGQSVGDAKKIPEIISPKPTVKTQNVNSTSASTVPLRKEESSSEKPKIKRIHGRPGVVFEPETTAPVSSSTTTLPTTVRKKKPLFTMITGDKESKESESFIESSTTGRDYVLPIVLMILSLPIVGYIIKLIYKRGTEFTERQQYHRMYLIDGMYNSR